MLKQQIIAVVLLVASSCGGISFAAQLAHDKQDFSTVENGRYLTVLGDCAACHTAPGGAPFAGGLPIETPFGDLVSPNITPDRETGIGIWTDQQFIDAMTKGESPGGVHLYPAMPYNYYVKTSRDDLLAIRAYLATITPVHNQVKSNRLPFPFNIRTSMNVWNALFFKPAAFQTRSDKSSEWNRGGYLVEGLMHCGVCHTPKNTFGADQTDARLSGYAVQGWFAPDITTDERRGIGGWSVDDLVAYLKNGHNRFTAANGPMADEIAQSSSQVSEADLHAVAVYLKDQPAPKQSSQPPAIDTAMMNVGAAIYGDECSACHTPTGVGIANMIPKLAGSPSVQSTDATSLVHMVLSGARSVATDGAPTAPAMPPFGWLLDDDQVAAVTTYIRNSWGNSAPKITASMVAKQRHAASRSD